MRSIPPRSIASREWPTIAGWVALTVFFLSTCAITSMALVDRRNLVCASEGTLIREWRFSPWPFGDVCTHTALSVTDQAVLVMQTGTVYLSFLTVVISCVTLAATRHRPLPPLSRSLLFAVVSAAVVATLAGLLPALTENPERQVVPLFAIWSTCVLSGATAYIVLVIGLVQHLLRLERNLMVES